MSDYVIWPIPLSIHQSILSHSIPLTLSENPKSSPLLPKETAQAQDHLKLRIMITFRWNIDLDRYWPFTSADKRGEEESVI
jgi:hypothetical protein